MPARVGRGLKPIRLLQGWIVSFVNQLFSVLFFLLILNLLFFMRRGSIGKASTFKLYAARAKYQAYLENIEKCTVAQKYPSLIDDIKSSSQSLYDICHNFREDSPCARGLNYDNRYLGFHSVDNQMVYHQYLGEVQEAYLLGQFNSFHPSRHQLMPDDNIGVGWYKLEWDLGEYRLDQGSRLQLRVIDKNGKEWVGAPPSCRVIDGQFGLYRKCSIRYHPTSNHKIAHLLAYTIDLEALSLDKCTDFIQQNSDLLECYNAVILKNLFSQKKSLIHKFSLSAQKSDQLEEVVERLSRLGLKVILEWNFHSATIQDPNNVDTLYAKQCGACEWQFNLTKDQAMVFYLSNIAYYFKQFGIRGLHFTKVHNLYRTQNGPLFIKIINVLCERLSDDSITLASSKQSIPGLTEPIQEGGLGFSFTYNHHESLSLVQQHDSIYQLVKLIQAGSNCLSITFDSVQKEDYIYLLFTFIIAKKGVFTRGSIASIKDELIKILRLRRQEELFSEEAEMMRINDECVMVSRGNRTVLFNFSKEVVSVEGDFRDKQILFSDTEEDSKIGQDRLMISGLNCIFLETVEEQE